MDTEKSTPIEQDYEIDKILDFVFQMARKRLRTSLSELRTLKALREEIKNANRNNSNTSRPPHIPPQS